MPHIRERLAGKTISKGVKYGFFNLFGGIGYCHAHTHENYKMKRPCRQPGCPELVTSGYCSSHAHYAPDPRERFKKLDDRVAPELRIFYSSAQWTKVSKAHRIREPLCRRCKIKGRAVRGELAHHNPPLVELLQQGKSPYDDKYLETLCGPCHQRELSLLAHPEKTN